MRHHDLHPHHVGRGRLVLEPGGQIDDVHALGGEVGGDRVDDAFAVGAVVTERELRPSGRWPFDGWTDGPAIASGCRGSLGDGDALGQGRVVVE